MKKGRHRRYEEARALKRNQDLDINEIFESLETGDGSVAEEGYSPAFEAWAEEFPGDHDPETVDLEEPDAKSVEPQDAQAEDAVAEELDCTG